MRLVNVAWKKMNLPLRETENYGDRSSLGYTDNEVFSEMRAADRCETRFVFWTLIKYGDLISNASTEGRCLSRRSFYARDPVNQESLIS